MKHLNIGVLARFNRWFWADPSPTMQLGLAGLFASVQFVAGELQPNMGQKLVYLAISLIPNVASFFAQAKRERLENSGIWGVLFALAALVALSMVVAILIGLFLLAT